MANLKFSVTISNDWILNHRDDEVLPALALCNYLKAKYEKDATVETIGFSIVKVDYTGDRDEQVLSLDVIEFFEDFYDVTKNSGAYSIGFDNLPEAEDLPPKDVFSDFNDEDLNDSLSYIEKILNWDASEKNNSKPSKKTVSDLLKECKAYQECEKLIGCKQFKNLAKELVAVAPEIKNNGTKTAFLGQIYLFSVNSGHGLSTAGGILAKLLYEVGLSEDDGYREFILPPKQGENNNAFEDVLSYVTQAFRNHYGVVCVDISEWMNEVNGKLFKNFLSKLIDRLDKFTLIFRIPFVDEEVLDNVKQSLNDLAFVKTIAFPPFSTQELRAYAKQRVESFGFSLTAKSFIYFDERITLEKADGRFYGMNTVKKVVDELLYNKQISNVTSKNPNKIIGVNDTKKLLGTSNCASLNAMEMLDKMVGCESVKQRIGEIIAQIEIGRITKPNESACIHMRFIGNPGTGKTTVARVIGKLLKEEGVLRVGSFFEYPGRYFCGRFIGETAPKTSSICRDAYGSVLFIDEAYSLYREGGSGADYGKEAIDTLIAEMENHRSDLLVIMAGYPDEMKTLMKANAGLESRMPYVIEFPNFTREELFEIYKRMIDGKFNYDSDLLSAVKNYLNGLSDEIINSKDFSNARFVRNLFERTWAKASMRAQLSGEKNICLKASDFALAISDNEFNFNTKKKNRMGFI